MVSGLELSWLMESCFMEPRAKADIEAIKIHANAKLPKNFFIIIEFGRPAGVHRQAEMGCATSEKVTS